VLFFSLLSWEENTGFDLPFCGRAGGLRALLVGLHGGNEGRAGVSWKAASTAQGKKREVPLKVSYSLPKYIHTSWV